MSHLLRLCNIWCLRFTGWQGFVCGLFFSCRHPHLQFWIIEAVVSASSSCFLQLPLEHIETFPSQTGDVNVIVIWLTSMAQKRNDKCLLSHLLWVWQANKVTQHFCQEMLNFHVFASSCVPLLTLNLLLFSNSKNLDWDHMNIGPEGELKAFSVNLSDKCCSKGFTSFYFHCACVEMFWISPGVYWWNACV